MTAFAPATVANVAAGFDVLGFAVGGIGDRVRLVRDDRTPGVRIAVLTVSDTRSLEDDRSGETLAGRIRNNFV